MRYRGDVTDSFHFQSRILQCAECGFPAGAWPSKTNLHCPHSVFFCRIRRYCCRLLRGIRRAFSRTFESHRTRA